MKIQPLRLRCVDSEFGQRKESLIVAANQLAGNRSSITHSQRNRRLLIGNRREYDRSSSGLPSAISSSAGANSRQKKIEEGSGLGAVCYTGKSPKLMNRHRMSSKKCGMTHWIDDALQKKKKLNETKLIQHLGLF